jgi:sugar (pentulose or hexulose) kinase
VPEWIVFALGGDPVREPSLASRTGLIDQGTGQVWPQALAAAGLPAGILPEERTAGRPAGYLRHDGVVSCAAGAVLTVAGHDHPVAAVGVGAVEADELFNSSGTADVLARSIPGTPPQAERQQVVTAGWSLGRHVLPDTSLLLAGVSGGLLLRRVLAALGAESESARSALDHASLSVGDLPAGLSVSGDGRTRTTSSSASRTTPRPPRSGRPRCATRRTRPGSCSPRSRRWPARTGGRWPPEAGRRWPACAWPRRPSSRG